MTSLLEQADALFHEGNPGEAAQVYQRIVRDVREKALVDEEKKALVGAARTLGFQFQNGVGVTVDVEESKRFYRVAAAYLDGPGTVNLAQLYFADGDAIRGANLLKRLIGKVEYAPALVELGRCFFTGDGVTFDADKAASLWQEAIEMCRNGKCDEGNLEACLAEATRSAKEATQLFADEARWQKYQDTVQEKKALRKGSYGPFKSMWGARGYVDFLRSKGITVDSVPLSSELRFANLPDGSFLRRPPEEELIRLAREIFALCDQSSSDLQDFDVWEAEDCMRRFVCGARIDCYTDSATGDTALHRAAANGHHGLAKSILRNGKMNGLVQNKAGLSAYEMAKEGDTRMQRLLPAPSGKAKPKSKQKRTAKAQAKTVAKAKSNNVLGEGMRKALEKVSSGNEGDAFFHDPAYYLRDKSGETQAPSLSVYGRGAGIHVEGTPEAEMIRKIQRMEDQRRQTESGDGAEPQKGDEEEDAEKIGPKQLEMSDAMRRTGNDAFANGNMAVAIAAYTYALLVRESSADKVLLSNRSAALLKARAPHLAAADAHACIEVDPTWPKAYLRLGRACEEMGGFKEACEWYSVGEKAARMLEQPRDAKTLVKARKLAKLKSKEPHLHARLAQEMGLASELFYTPVCAPDVPGGMRDISVAAHDDYFTRLTNELGVKVKDIALTASVGGGRGLFAERDFQQGERVLVDTPLVTVSYDASLCDYCGDNITTTSSIASADGYETYCCEHCRKAAEAQYYGYFLQDIELGKRFNTFRQMLPSQGNIAETFHGAAAIKIAAATMLARRRGDIGRAAGTFDLPAFYLLSRPGDLGTERLRKAAFKIPFAERYAQFEGVRDVLGQDVQKDIVKFGFEWFTNIWGTLMTNSINGNGASNAPPCVNLMRLGSFINHSDDPNLKLLPGRDAQRHGLVFQCTRPIRKGEELTIAYIGKDRTEDERKRVLATQYFIDPEE